MTEINQESGAQIQCPECRVLNPPGSATCNQCGISLVAPGISPDLWWDYRSSRLRARSVQLVMGFCFSGIMTYLTYFTCGLYPNSLVHRILVPDGLQILLPVAIVALTFWPLGVVLIRFWFAAMDQRRFSPAIHSTLKDLLIPGPEISSDDKARKTAAFLKVLSPLLFSRVQILRGAIKNRDSQRSLQQRFEIETDLEDQETEGNYALIHLFIWALPILGFLGTVIGITMAVARFSGFLGGNIDDIELIKSELGQVTNGLSFAFGTTILGLAGALVVMLFTSITQNYETNFFTRIRRFSVEHLAPLIRNNSE